MAQDNVSKIGNFIASNKKPLLYIGGAIAVVVIGYALISRVKKGIGKAFTDRSTGATAFKSLPVDEEKATISNEIANTYANQLYGAMSNAGTDSSLIYSIMGKLQKKDDFLKVYNSFGKRSYVGFAVGGSPNALDKALGNYEDLDLVQWLNEEIGWSTPLTYTLVKKTVENAGLTI